MTAGDPRLWGWALLAIAVYAGLYGRLSGFGGRQLAVDEFYFAEAIALIPAHGVAAFSDGGYYLQGLIPQYLTAACFELFGVSAGSLRLPSLLCGLLVVWLGFRYARLHLPTALAAAVAAALLLSSWEIEFSRFGRMYAALQCATLAFLWRFDRSLAGPQWGKRYRAHLWALLLPLCHFLGAALAPLLLAPLLDWRNSRRFPDRGSLLRYTAISTAVIAVAGWFAWFDFRRWGVAEPFPESYIGANLGSFRSPEFAFWAAQAGSQTRLLIVLAVLCGVLAAGALLARRGKAKPVDVAFALLLGSAVLHQGALAAVFALILLFRFEAHRTLPQSRSQIWMAAAAAVFGLGWIGVAALGGNRWIAAAGAGSWLGATRRTFLSWPNWIDPLWRPWAQDLPILGLLILASIAVLLISDRKLPRLDLVRGPGGALCYALVVFGVLQYAYESTRYTYLFHAVGLAAIALALSRCLRPRAALCAFAVAVGLSGDFDPRHIRDAGTFEVAHRLNRHAGSAPLWYARPDYSGAAEHLREAALLEPQALFLVHNCPPLAGEFDPPRYASYAPRAGPIFYEWSRTGGSRDVWARRLLLSTPEEVREHSLHDAVVWLVSTGPPPPELRPRSVWGARVEKVERRYVSAGGRIEVLRVELSGR